MTELNDVEELAHWFAVYFDRPKAWRTYVGEARRVLDFLTADGRAKLVRRTPTKDMQQSIEAYEGWVGVWDAAPPYTGE